MNRRSLTTWTTSLIAVALMLGPITGGALAAPQTDQAGSRSDLRAVIDWTAIARHASIDVAGQAPGESLAQLGLLQAAAYNAVVAITGSHAPYGRGAAPQPGASVDVAVAAAAHAVLVHAFPDQRDELDAAYGDWLIEHASYLSIVNDPSVQAGIRVGTEAAAAAIELGATAGSGGAAR